MFGLAKRCPAELRPFFAVHHEFQVRDDVIMPGIDRVVVPSTMRAQYFDQAHLVHDRIVRTKQLSRSLS